MAGLKEINSTEQAADMLADGISSFEAVETLQYVMLCKIKRTVMRQVAVVSRATGGGWKREVR